MAKRIITPVFLAVVLAGTALLYRSSDVTANGDFITSELRIGVSSMEKQGDVAKSLVDAISDLVKVDLQNYNNVKVIPLGSERKALLRELELHQTGLVDDAYKIDPGKFLGANKIVQGKVSKLLNAYFITLHVMDVKTGSYDVSRKVTVCSAGDVPARTTDLVRAVVMGLGGQYVNPDEGAVSCVSMEQSRVEENFQAIGSSYSLAEIPVRHIQASSVLYEPGFDHNPWVMIDGVIETAWADGKQKSSGAGEWLLFSFDAGKTVEEIGIVNGLGLITGKWGNLYAANAAVRTAELLYSNGMKETISLKKTHEVQHITLKNAGSIYWMKLTITGEYPGTKYQDTCISEIKFYGR